MTCKDCIHYYVCEKRKNSISLDPVKCGYRCHDFKNRADYVEVVRCGKCKHGGVSVFSKTVDGEEGTACYCNAKNKVTDLEYYCACGERRDT